MKVLVAGAGGMVGRAVTQHCRFHGDEVLAYDHTRLDIASAENVQREITGTQPDAVINCAAWTDVDGCERNPQKSDAVNALGPKNLAQASLKAHAVFITISTDYVFDGRKEGFYTQEDQTNPLSVYGKSKREGERLAQQANPGTIVVRSGFIFGPGGRNFLSVIPQPLSQSQPVKAISDAWGTPTYGVNLAERLRELAQLNVAGIYHVVNAGEGATYEEFAREVTEALSLDPALVQGVLSSTLDRPAPRPRNSRMRCLVSAARGLQPLPSWRSALREYLSTSGFPVA